MIVGYKKRGDEGAGKGFYDGIGIKGGNDIIPDSKLSGNQ
jgi:hypothetical protein